jgi:hypothetical protein
VPRGKLMGVNCHMSDARPNQEVLFAFIDPLSRILESRYEHTCDLCVRRVTEAFWQASAARSDDSYTQF